MIDKASADYLERRKIGSELKFERIKRQYSVLKVAKLLGISKESIRAYEDGLEDIPQKYLGKLYRLYAKHPDEIYITITKELAKTLKNARVASKFTLTDAANFIGIQPMSLSSCEKNVAKRISLDTCRKLEMLYSIKILND